MNTTTNVKRPFVSQHICALQVSWPVLNLLIDRWMPWWYSVVYMREVAATAALCIRTWTASSASSS